MVYALEEEQLVSLLKQAYEQGVYGHFDLAQTVAESMLEQCKDRQLTNPYYKPDYLETPNLEIDPTTDLTLPPWNTENAALCETEGARIEYQGHNYPSDPNISYAATPCDLPEGTEVVVVNNEVPNSNQEGFHWEPYSLAEGRLIREEQNVEESRKRLRC
jgi:hypothetical protein